MESGFVGSSAWTTRATRQVSATSHNRRLRLRSDARTPVCTLANRKKEANIPIPETTDVKMAGRTTDKIVSPMEQLQDLADCSGSANFASVSVFDVKYEWERHRSNTRYLRHILGLPTSELLWRVAPTCGVVALETLALAWYTDTTGMPLGHVTPLPFSLMASVIGLLLVFRTNSAYERFVEGRVTWATLVCRSRDLVRLSLVGMEKKYMDQVVRYTAAFCFCLKLHLRGEKSEVMEDVLSDYLTVKEVQTVMEKQHRPNAIAMLISASIAADPSLERNLRNKLHGEVGTFIDVIGISERILRTPIPLQYTRQTIRTILPWCFAMPLLLMPILGPVAGAFHSIVITFLCLGIEDIGVNIEDPFRVLPLDQLCSTISSTCFELHANRDQAAECIALTRTDNDDI